jgi:small subunit ribosomal protein S6
MFVLLVSLVRISVPRATRARLGYHGTRVSTRKPTYLLLGRGAPVLPGVAVPASPRTVETDSTGPPETEGGTLQDLHPYEVMVVLDPEADEARQEDVIARIRQIVEEAGGQLEAADSLGRQRLAYEILKRSEAFRWVVTLTAPPAAVEEVDRVLRIHDDVLRHMIVRRTGRSTGPFEETVPVS